MDYEKAYKKALERAKSLCAMPTDRATMEHIFPELKESEDERIRKRISLCLDECVHSDIIRDYERDECLAYLEKQKEQKTDAKSERVIKAAKRVLNNWLDGTDCPDVSGDFAELEYAIREYDGEEKQKEQKPLSTEETELNSIAFLEQMGYTCIPPGAKPAEKSEKPIIPEWSEEDEEMKEQPEVDLEKEFNDFLDNVEGVPRMWHPDEQIEWAKDIARHFYELGLNARKEK